MIALGVLVSGSGSNLQAILDAIRAHGRRARRRRCLQCARRTCPRAGSHCGDSDRRRRPPRLRKSRGLRCGARRGPADLGVELVVLAGFLRVVSDVLLGAFPWKVLLHPALLPAFPGLHAQRQAVEAGVRVAGCTVHLVDAGTDTGPIIAQAAVPVHSGDDEETLRERILEQEHILLPRVLQWFAEGRVEIVPSSTPSLRPRIRVHGASTALGLREAG